MEIAALVISLVAIGVAGVTALFVWRQTVATEDSVGHQARSADAVQEAVSYQRDEIERSRVDFRFEHVNNHRYVLRNAGSHSAHSVTVDLGDLDRDEPVTTFAEFPAGHERPYLIQRLLDQTTTHVVVTWHYHPDDSGPPQVTRLLLG